MLPIGTPVKHAKTGRKGIIYATGHDITYGYPVYRVHLHSQGKLLRTAWSQNRVRRISLSEMAETEEKPEPRLRRVNLLETPFENGENVSAEFWRG